jgi:hypothetical protein
MIHIYGIITSQQQQKSICQFNGQTGNSISETVTIAAGASHTFTAPLYGDFFRQCKPFMPAIKNDVMVSINWHEWDKFAKSAAGTVNLGLQLLSLILTICCFL